MENLEKELQRFFNTFQSMYPSVKDMCVLEAYEGLAGTPYNIHLIAPNMPNNIFYPALSQAVKTLWQTTSPAIRKNIFNVCIETSQYFRCNKL